MDQKLISIITTAISMVAVLIYFVLGFFFNMWHPGWIVFVVAGIADALVVMIGKYTYDKKHGSPEDNKNN